MLSDRGVVGTTSPVPPHGTAPAVPKPSGAAGLVGVAAAYFLGSHLGFVLRFPPDTTSVLWPPNAILTAALLLVPPRRFWAVLLAALPAHLAAQLPMGMPLGLSLALFVTNCAEAFLAAWLVHRWSDEPAGFDSLRRVLIFIAAAVVIAPFATTAADAAAVYILRDEPFGVVFIRRLFSNVLSQLTIVPSAVLLVGGVRAWLRGSPPRRRIEMALLAFALLAIGGLVLPAYHGAYELPAGPFAALPLLMPLLVTAAVRFGPGGASLSLLGTALLATGIAVSRADASGIDLAEQRVRALQVFLTAVGAPLLCLSALVAERERAAARLRERLRFEELLSQISAAFVHVPRDGMREAFGDALGRLGRLLRLDAAVLSSGDGASAFPGSEPVVWTNGRSPHAAGAADAIDPFRAQGVLALPLEASGEVVGRLVLESPLWQAWPRESLEGARLVADVFASALARRRAEDARRASEVMNTAVLSSLPHHVAVLDRDGRIVAVNEAWTRFMRDNCDVGGSGVGDNYLDQLRISHGPRPHDLVEIANGIENVLAGRAPTFSGEYMTPIGDHWVHATVVPLKRPDGGVVLSYADVNERHLAEDQANQLRDELAHCLRISTIGELTSSIAHELNQPLAAILANAQAARRLLAGDPRMARHHEIHEILDDIVAEDRRAGEVIRGVRHLLRKGARQPEEVDLNALVREVLKLAANAAMIRAITLRRILVPARMPVRGDPVQLQQVLLNLLLNAFEAMSDAPGERVVFISTEKRPPGMATISVSDTGIGLPQGNASAVFEPFYTTKETGLGMGLSIARSIVEAHGGTISAFPGVDGGATVQFTLPLVNQRSAETAVS